MTDIIVVTFDDHIPWGMCAMMANVLVTQFTSVSLRAGRGRHE